MAARIMPWGDPWSLSSPINSQAVPADRAMGPKARHLSINTTMRKPKRITSAKVYQAVRKAMPKPTRAFRSRVVFKASSRKVWKQELE